MQITLCDCCNEPARPALRVTLVETHPHAGDEIRTPVDICQACAPRLALEVRAPLPIFPPLTTTAPA